MVNTGSPNELLILALPIVVLLLTEPAANTTFVCRDPVLHSMPPVTIKVQVPAPLRSPPLKRKLVAVAGVAVSAVTVTVPADSSKLPAPLELLPVPSVKLPPFTKKVFPDAMLILPVLVKVAAPLLIVPASTLKVPVLEPFTLMAVVPVPVFFVNVPALLKIKMPLPAGVIALFPVAVITPVMPLLIEP